VSGTAHTALVAYAMVVTCSPSVAVHSHNVCLQTDEVETHPSLLDQRLQGLKDTPAANARLLSLHAHLVGLRCQYYWMLHRWTEEMRALMHSIQNRGLAATADEALSKANGSVAACPFPSLSLEYQRSSLLAAYVTLTCFMVT
jgi:hypothetical protein